MKLENNHLRLGVDDLSPAFKDKPPAQPKFFHFSDIISAKVFHEADVITFTFSDGKEVVMKDRYSNYSSKA